jgi:hypothetical protein
MDLYYDDHTEVHKFFHEFKVYVELSP